MGPFLLFGKLFIANKVGGQTLSLFFPLLVLMDFEICLAGY
jgi:hypothetical protein